MFRLKLIPRIILFAVLAACVPALVFSNLVMGEEVRRARERYEQTAANLQRTDQELQHVESQLKSLTTSVDAVELEVRRSLRMMRPGEKFVVIQHEPTGLPR